MMGRELRVSLAVDHVACYTHFETLCCADRGAADYRALSLHFPALFLEGDIAINVVNSLRKLLFLFFSAGVPRLSVLKHDQARRFITLVDELYEARTLFFWTAERHPSELFIPLSEEMLRNEAELGTLAVDHTWSTKEAERAPHSRFSDGGFKTCILSIFQMF